METSIIALIIMAVTLILFVSEKLPLAITATLSMVAMAFTGCVPYSQAFAGFSSTAVLMIIGTGIIGAACFSTGLADAIGKWVLKFDRLEESRFVLIIVIIGTLLSAPLSGIAVMVMLMPIIDAIAAKTNGRITRKNTYLPLGIATVLGGNLSAIGSTSMINASAMLGESYCGREFTFFEPAKLGFIGALVPVAMALIFKTKLQNKFFDFEGYSSKSSRIEKEDDKNRPAWKMYFVGAVLIGCTIAYILGINYGAVSLLGGCLVVVFGCIDMERVISGVSWNTVLVVAGTLGFAKGVEISGAGEIIADIVIGVCGPLAESAFGMCVVLMFVSTILSNFTSNNATIGICVPIALSIAQALGADPAVFVLCCAVGTNLSVATPMCTAPITITASAGYRFKDYFRYGGIQNALAFIGTVIALKIFYF